MCNKSMIILYFRTVFIVKIVPEFAFGRSANDELLSSLVHPPSTISVVISFSLKHHFFLEIIKISMGGSLRKFLF